ncbi:hypothetical protein KFK09_024048 [Dendrobium nobile]|uniref:DDE Tnp4 domain-containing protein n=1 Tax=Dendrobium nobile TaxID=94219 RepID=A0A8T3ACX5_DENNO|nr:hypothetical protein KFK09_024048 [Dendrobium nobile]
MLLHTLGHIVRNQVIRFNFHRSGETVSRYFKAALHAVGELRNEFIKPPPPETPYKIKSNGTHIKAMVPKENKAAFRGRKPYPTQNVLAAVDFDLKITYVLAGWEGSAHDVAIPKNALERSDGLCVPAEGGDEFIQSKDEWAKMSYCRRRDQAVVDDSREWLDKRDEIAQFMWTRMQNDAFAKDAAYLNIVIANYVELEIVCGIGHATGEWAKFGNSQTPLGTQQIHLSDDEPP